MEEQTYREKSTPEVSNGGNPSLSKIKPESKSQLAFGDSDAKVNNLLLSPDEIIDLFLTKNKKNSFLKIKSSKLTDNEKINLVENIKQEIEIINIEVPTPKFSEYCATTMPLDLIRIINSWDHISLSPYSCSLYNFPGKSWHWTKPGGFRVSDHWINEVTYINGKSESPPSDTWAIGRFVETNKFKWISTTFYETKKELEAKGGRSIFVKYSNRDGEFLRADIRLPDDIKLYEDIDSEGNISHHILDFGYTTVKEGNDGYFEIQQVFTKQGVLEEQQIEKQQRRQYLKKLLNAVENNFDTYEKYSIFSDIKEYLLKKYSKYLIDELLKKGLLEGEVKKREWRKSGGRFYLESENTYKGPITSITPSTITIRDGYEQIVVNGKKSKIPHYITSKDFYVLNSELKDNVIRAGEEQVLKLNKGGGITNYVIGEYYIHPRFGKGKLLAINSSGESGEFEFENGDKKSLLFKFANLTHNGESIKETPTESSPQIGAEKKIIPSKSTQKESELNKKDKKVAPNSILGKVLAAQDTLKAMTSPKQLRDWAISNGMDNRSAFPRFKSALNEIGMDYDTIKQGIQKAAAEKLESQVTHEVTLYCDAKASHNQFGITDKDGNVLWYGKFFGDEHGSYDGEQSSGELAAALKAVWLASKIKEAAEVPAIRLNLIIDAQWLTYQDHAGQKGYALSQSSKRLNVQLNVEWISGKDNPADEWTTASGYKKWSDNDLASLAEPIKSELEIEEIKTKAQEEKTTTAGTKVLEGPVITLDFCSIIKETEKAFQVEFSVKTYKGREKIEVWLPKFASKVADNGKLMVTEKFWDEKKVELSGKYGNTRLYGFHRIMEKENAIGIMINVTEYVSDQVIKRWMWFPKSQVISYGDNEIIVTNWIFNKKKDEVESEASNMQFTAHVEVGTQNVPPELIPCTGEEIITSKEEPKIEELPHEQETVQFKMPKNLNDGGEIVIGNTDITDIANPAQPRFADKEAVNFTSTVEGRYTIGESAIIDGEPTGATLGGDYYYSVKQSGKLIENVPEHDMESAFSGINRDVDLLLREKEKNKEVTDSDIRPMRMKKTAAAYRGLINLQDLDKLELDTAMAKSMVKKEKIFPVYDTTAQIDKGVSGGALYLKLKAREFCGTYPPDTPEARKTYTGLLLWFYEVTEPAITIDAFFEACTLFLNGIIRKSLVIIDPTLEETLQQQKAEMEEKAANKKRYTDKIAELDSKIITLNNEGKILNWYNFQNNKIDWVANSVDKDYLELKKEYEAVKKDLREISAFSWDGELPIEGEFLKGSGKGSREGLITDLFGDKFYYLLKHEGYKYKAVNDALEQAPLYDPFTKEEAEKAYTSEIKPLEDDIVKWQGWVDFLSDESKPLRERLDYAEADNKISWGYGTARSFRNFESYRKAGETNMCIQLINYGIKRWKEDITHNIKRIETLKENYRVRDNVYSWINADKQRRAAGERAELQVNSYPPLSYIKRVGGVAIFDSDLETGDKIKSFYRDILGLTSIGYGISMPDKERLVHSKHFAGAMLDMAEALNWDVKELTGFGGLGIKFGASGTGKAAVHYEPDTHAINLTRRNGDGSVSHELTHYIDHTIARKFPQDNKSVKRHTSYGSYITAKNISNAAIYKAMWALMDFIIRGTTLNLETNKPILSDDNKELFEPLLPLLEEFCENMLSSTIIIDVEANEKNKPYGKHYKPSIDEELEVLKEEKPDLFFYNFYRLGGKDNLSRQVLEGTVALHGLKKYPVTFSNSPAAVYEEYRGRIYKYRSKNARTGTQYYSRSANVGSDYWIYFWELLARAAECYFADKLTLSGRYNNYLVSGSLFEDPAGVYPSGIERKILYVLYDNLFAVIKKELNIADFVSFREERANEYIELSGEEEQGTKIEEIVAPEGEKVMAVIENKEEIKKSGESEEEKYEDKKEEIQNKKLEPFDENIINEITTARHSLHSSSFKDIFRNSRSFDEDIENIANSIRDLNITGTEKELADKIQSYSNLSGGDRKFRGEWEDIPEGKEQDDYEDKAREEINKEKEEINNLVENYLGKLDEIWDNYELDDVSDYRKNTYKSFKPSGYARARSLLGTGENNRSKAEKYESILDIEVKKALGKSQPPSESESKMEVPEKVVIVPDAENERKSRLSTGEEINLGDKYSLEYANGEKHDPSIIGQKEDFKGDKKLNYQKTYREFTDEQRRRVGATDFTENEEVFKKHYIDTIEKAIREQHYQSDISEGRMTADDAVAIITSADLKVPEDILSLTGNDKNKIIRMLILGDANYEHTPETRKEFEKLNDEFEVLSPTDKNTVNKLFAKYMNPVYKATHLLELLQKNKMAEGGSVDVVKDLFSFATNYHKLEKGGNADDEERIFIIKEWDSWTEPERVRYLSDYNILPEASSPALKIWAKRKFSDLDIGVQDAIVTKSFETAFADGGNANE